MVYARPAEAAAERELSAGSESAAGSTSRVPPVAGEAAGWPSGLPLAVRDAVATGEPFAGEGAAELSSLPLAAGEPAAAPEASGRAPSLPLADGEVPHGVRTPEGAPASVPRRLSAPLQAWEPGLGSRRVEPRESLSEVVVQRWLDWTARLLERDVALAAPEVEQAPAASRPEPAWPAQAATPAPSTGVDAPWPLAYEAPSAPATAASDRFLIAEPAEMGAPPRAVVASTSTNVFSSGDRSWAPLPEHREEVARAEPNRGPMAGGGPTSASTNVAQPQQQAPAQPDVDVLARQVYALIKQRLNIERERAGLTRGFRK